MRIPRARTLAPAAAVALTLGTLGFATLVPAQHAGHGPAPAPAPITMEELHRTGGVPPGWKFALPPGNPKTGREIFAKLECNKCHEAKPDFPRAGAAGDVGPALTGMGGHHPAEYFAQSVVDPNAVIVAGAGFVGPDGRSIMPDYRDSLTFAELVDLVAYIKSLDGGAHDHQDHGPAAREQTAGPYRVRVEYKGGNHLMVFVADAATGEPVPYLPVTATITAARATPRTLKLVPMIGGTGFHYGVDVTLPEGTTKVALRLGAAALKTMGAVAGRFAKPVTVSFDWSD